MDSTLSTKQIGVVGAGMVGGALLKYFETTEMRPVVYDPPKNIGSLEDLNRVNIVFICVPTPFIKERQGFDLSYVEKTVENLTGEKIVVIKSTVLPGTTEDLQKKYPQHTFLFNPEFLVEERAVADMLNPDRQIVGYTEQSKEFAESILRILPKAPYEKVMPATEAEMVKYFGNTFLAVKVIFGCQMHELCQKLGVDYDIVREAASADERIGPSHLDVRHGGYMGYGGKCLPKDTRALIQFADASGVDLRLHKATEELNNALMDKQGIEDPEKFSKRG